MQNAIYYMIVMQGNHPSKDLYDGNRLNNGLLTLTGTGDLFFNAENVREFLLRLKQNREAR